MGDKKNEIKKTKEEEPKTMEVSHEELAEWSGETTVRRFKYQVPILKFNGKKGSFSLLVPDEAGNWIPEDIAKGEIEIVVLKVRRVLSSYEKLSDGSGIRNFTNEHNNWQDPLTVFEMKKGDAKPRMLDAGQTKDIREKFPNLKLRQNLYCLYNDQIVKLTARGKSLSALFDYYAEFQGDEHIYQFNTKLTCHQEGDADTLEYFVIDYERGKEVDLPTIAAKIKEVKTKIDLQDKQFASRSVPEMDKQPERHEEKLEEENVDNKPESQENEEMVEVNDIPS